MTHGIWVRYRNFILGVFRVGKAMLKNLFSDNVPGFIRYLIELRVALIPKMLDVVLKQWQSISNCTWVLTEVLFLIRVYIFEATVFENFHFH